MRFEAFTDVLCLLNRPEGLFLKITGFQVQCVFLSGIFFWVEWATSTRTISPLWK